MSSHIDEEKIRKLLIKQKKDFEEWKKEEGDSDIIFNQKDNKRETKKK